MQSDQWVVDYDAARESCNDTLSLIQERNLKYADGGPEASRITAAARRKLGTLGTLLDNLRTSLESAQCAKLTENERNRRRDLLTALRSRREQMLQALKRDQRSARSTLLGDSGDGSGAGPARETDATAELDSHGLLSMQHQVMHQQDRELEQLERSVSSTKHVALQINEETTLHNRLLTELDTDLDATASRMGAAQRRLKVVMRRASSCRTQLLLFLMVVILVVVVILGFKLAVHF